MTQQSHYWAYTQRKTIIQKDTCTPMFTAALFTIARSWRQPKCPSTDEWIKKMWYIDTMEYYSAIQRNEIGSFVETWMDLETVIQSEVSQKEKNKYRILTHICGTQKNGTDEPVCKVEIETQMQRTNVWIPRSESRGGGMNWEIGIDIYTLICIKQITNKNLLYKKIKLKKKRSGNLSTYFETYSGKGIQERIQCSLLLH